MDNRKLLILIILSIFVVGMILAPASASHTYKCGKYKCKITNKQYKKLKKGKVGTWVSGKNVGKKKFVLKFYDYGGNLLGKKTVKVKTSISKEGRNYYVATWYCKDGIIQEKRIKNF
jgi:hypothetical protein